MITIIAKLKVGNMALVGDDERLYLSAVERPDMPADGLDPANNYAAWRPAFDANIVVNNPAMRGEVELGDVYEVQLVLKERNGQPV